VIAEREEKEVEGHWPNA